MKTLDDLRGLIAANKVMRIIDPLSCDGCGVCCLEQESPPMYLWYLLNRDDGDEQYEDAIRARSLPEDLKRELIKYSNALVAGKPHPNNRICLWFDEDSRQCKHYDLRPDICRELQIGDEGCIGWREQYAKLIAK